MSNSISIKSTLYWAQLETKNDLSDKFQVDVGQLSDAAVAALETMGIEVQFKEDRGHYVTCKSTRPIYAKDGDGASLRGIKIGNGSLAVAVISPYEWTFKSKRGVSPSLNKLIITDLVEYNDEDEEETNLDEAL